jgi:hypothetical protein
MLKNKIERVLITGASGGIAKIARSVYSDKKITLLSRSKICVNKNENWIQSQDLNNFQWWSSLEFDYKFDLVLHFAEPVKASISDEYVNNISDSHISFLSNISNSNTLSVYPLTAYRYDKILYGKEYKYSQIKNKTFSALNKNKNILFPVFHPVIDYGSGLYKIINLNKKIPFVNIFYSFDAKLPVLNRSTLHLFLENLKNYHTFGVVDVYSDVQKVSSIFSSNKRLNIGFMSILFKTVLRLFYFVPQIRLLLDGRKINTP